MNFSTTRHIATGFANDLTPTAQVVPFVRTGARRSRREAIAPERRGQILLFTGVRYERMPEATVQPGSVTPRRRRS